MGKKIEIPEELKADLPQNQWGKLLAATPIIMTVIATALAGLASSEMTRAQYDRSLAAQQQSKAGDQWGYFQAKKLRGALQRNTLDILTATADLHPLVETALPNADAATVAALQKAELPKYAPAKFDDNVTAALKALENSAPDTEIAAALAKVNDAALNAAFAAAKQSAIDFDAATKPVNQAIDQLEKNLGAGEKSLVRDFTAARLRYTSARYDAEARLNQTVANVLELQVRKNNISAERHHQRSGRFFFGMLAAQMGVIVSTFAMAARKRSLLWAIAAAAGAGAVSFALYVYLFI